MEILSVKNLSKIYHLYNSPVQRIIEAVHPLRKKYHREFYALKNVNVSVNRGECVGIVGMNGGGKSTLLQCIAGILTPTAGTVSVKGSISAMLELGAGFNPEFTGIENIKFQCALMGVSQSKVPSVLEDVLQFAEIGDFAFQPVKTYSSGMYVRLAFAVAISVDPDLLIIDEALAVGDAYFQAKCMKRIKDFRASGRTLLFVSHDPGAVKSLCEKAYLLHKGQIVESGTPDHVFNLYNGILSMQKEEGDVNAASKDFKQAISKRSGSKDLEIISVEMLNVHGQSVETFASGERVKILVTVHVNKDVDNPTIGVLIRDRLGQDIFGVNNSLMGLKSGLLKAGSRYRASFEMDLDLGVNVYSLTVALHKDVTHVQGNYDWLNDALIFRVVPSADFAFIGYCRLEPHFSISG